MQLSSLKMNHAVPLGMNEQRGAFEVSASCFVFDQTKQEGGRGALRLLQPRLCCNQQLRI